MGSCCPKEELVPRGKTIALAVDEVPIEHVYKFDDKVLGGGSFGVVRQAWLVASPKEKVAVKTINKASVGDNLDLLRREIAIMLEVDHPHIVRFYHVYEDAQYIHMVMENCAGGELFERIQQHGHLTEHTARDFMRQMLMAVRHIHQCGIVHRDVKPQNFLFDIPGTEGILKLVDFGLSNKFAAGLNSLHSCVGTINFVAPEVLHKNYDAKCDLWGLGVILYLMLSGHLPFEGQNLQELVSKICTASYEMEGPAWQEVSSEAKDLVSSLLVVSTTARLDAIQALAHPWFQSLMERRSTLSKSAMESLKSFRAASDFEKKAMNVLVRHLPSRQIDELTSVFYEFDQLGSGKIGVQAFTEGLAAQGYQLEESEIQNIIASMGINRDGLIHYSDFLAAASYSKRHIEEGEAWAAFNHFDVDRTGTITTNNLKLAYAKLDLGISPAEAEELVSSSGISPEGITFAEFKDLLMKHGRS